MKALLRILIAVLLIVVTAGCTSANGKPGGLEIRIANRSDRDFDKVDVTFTSDKVEYGAIPKGGMSAYKQVKEAYRYAKIDIVANGEAFTFQPIDFVGETLLEPGRYTYALNVDPTDHIVTIDLVKD